MKSVVVNVRTHENWKTVASCLVEVDKESVGLQQRQVPQTCCSAVLQNPNCTFLVVDDVDDVVRRSNGDWLRGGPKQGRKGQMTSTRSKRRAKK